MVSNNFLPDYRIIFGILLLLSLSTQSGIEIVIVCQNHYSSSPSNCFDAVLGMRKLSSWNPTFCKCVTEDKYLI